MRNDPAKKIYKAVITDPEDLQRAELYAGIELAKELKQDIRILAKRGFPVTIEDIGCSDIKPEDAIVKILYWHDKENLERLECYVYAEEIIKTDGSIQCTCGKRFDVPEGYVHHIFRETDEPERGKFTGRGRPLGLMGAGSIIDVNAMRMAMQIAKSNTDTLMVPLRTNKNIELRPITMRDFMKSSILNEMLIPKPEHLKNIDRGNTLEIFGFIDEIVDVKKSIVDNQQNIMNYLDRRS